eukprot:53047_1
MAANSMLSHLNTTPEQFCSHLKQGWIKKRSRHLKQWRKRYTTIEENKFFCTYQNEEMTNCTEKIDISESTIQYTIDKPKEFKLFLNKNNNNGFHFIYRINGNENEEEIFYKYYGNTNKSEEIKIIAKDLSNVNYGWGMNRGQFVESNLFYCKELNRILINKTYYEDRGRNYYHKWGYIDLNMNNNELKYRKIEIDMKMNCNKNYILGFGHLLFIFDIRLPQSIYCWDLLTNKYYECLKRFPKAKKKKKKKNNNDITTFTKI